MLDVNLSDATLAHIQARMLICERLDQVETDRVVKVLRAGRPSFQVRLLRRLGGSLVSLGRRLEAQGQSNVKYLSGRPATSRG